MTDLRQEIEQEPTCPKCKAAVLYECVACSNNNYPPRPEQEPCIGKDPRCPCQDGDACHYKDCGDTKALPVPVAQRPWVGLEPEEVLDLFDRNNVYGSKWIEFARAIEAALRSKNK